MSLIASPLRHLPAWKKIGLKLKYAKEELEEDIANEITSRTLEEKSAANGKRKTPNRGELEVADANAGRTLKKSKQLKDTSPPSESLVNTISRPDEVLEEAQMADRTSARKRKSVSFTTETKAEDGDSSKQIDNAWLLSRLAKDPSSNPLTLNPALKSKPASRIPPNPSTPSNQAITSAPYQTSETPSTQPLNSPKSLTNSEKHKKKKGKPKHKSRGKQAIDPSQPDPPHLTYLHTYHTLPSTWKFSKPQQNYILRHLFSLRQIPASYDPALQSYLQGLKGGAARERLRAQAFDVRKEDNDWLASELPKTNTKELNGAMDTEPDSARHERRRREYEAQVQHMKQILRGKEEEREDREWEFCGEKEEWQRRLKRRRRAEAVLWGVGEAPAREEADEVKPRKSGSTNGVIAVNDRNRWMLGRDAQKMNGATAVPKKIVFRSEDGAATGTVHAIHGVCADAGDNVGSAVNGIDGHVKPPEPSGFRNGKKPRKRRAKKRTGVPDNDDTSSSSDDSSNSDAEMAGGSEIAD